GDTQRIIKHNIVVALDIVAKQLGNTRTVCKKYYVHPVVITLYENNSLEKYFFGLHAIKNTAEMKKLTAEEKIMMRILEKEKLSHP
ncbi:MAG TPA: DNA topoisomerase IB, partial [Bacteroidia bacterium]|nr:DNA topoisomerase IB [Bacteroidia bacterium]